MLLTEILPLLADELEQLLKKAGKPLLDVEMTSAHPFTRNRSLRENTVPGMIAWIWMQPKERCYSTSLMGQLPMSRFSTVITSDRS